MAPRVLLVDDDPTIVRLLEVNFRLGGFDVETAMSGEEAVKLATETVPDAIVMDVMLPGLSGYEVGQLLRDTPPLAATPLVFITARPIDDLRGTADLERVDVVSKPFDPASLVELVRSRLGEAGG